MTITGQDDTTEDGDITYNIIFYDSISSDANYNGITIENFLEQGPLASLPLKSQISNFYSSIVWSYNKPNYFKFLHKLKYYYLISIQFYEQQYFYLY